MEFKSSNPFLSEKKFENTSRVHNQSIAFQNSYMSIESTINKSFVMLLLLLSTALVSWWLVASGYSPMIFTIGGGVAGFVLVLIASFKPTTAPYTAPAYALFEGLFIGGLSAVFEAMYPGLVIQAVSATFITFIVCFGLYKYQVVKVTETFKSVVIGATLAIFVFYLISWIASFFITFQPIHQGNSLMSIGISVFVIVVAALNLFLDFDMIEKSIQTKAPKYMEWFAAMGLMITLVWLYVEFLRLFSKLSSRD
ncbi:MAG TPA: hypothetical protein DDZ41_00600 [Flavobacterium sp.]|nr:hypothetical protein [Flavobacterium sp.]